MLRGKMDDTPGLEKMVIDQHLLKRLGQPVELAQAVCWLLSERASFVTGANSPVDDGQTA